MGDSLQGATQDPRSSIRLEPLGAWRPAPAPSELQGAAVSFADYIEEIFVPGHISVKTSAGRVHYQSILKHILTPETVERIFAPYGSKSRLRTLPDWPYLDHVRLCDLTSEHVRRLIISASGRGYSPQTIKHIKNVVGRVISHARKEGFFRGENPASEIKLPAIQHRNVHKLTIAEAKAIVRRMQYPEREVALITMTTGMTVSEICALRWKDVNLADAPVYCDGEVIPPRHARVKQQQNDPDNVSPSASRMRIVEIPEPLARRLQRLRRETWHFQPETFLLESHGGFPLRPLDICSPLESIGRETGIPWLSWPALRRAHQTLLSDLRVQLSDELMLGVH